MDERKKAIKDILIRKREKLHALELLEEDLGKLLLAGFSPAFSAAAANPVYDEKKAAYGRLLAKEDEYCENLKTVEDTARRLGHIEEELQNISSESAAKSFELEEIFLEIGEEAAAIPAVMPAAMPGFAGAPADTEPPGASPGGPIESSSRRIAALEAERASLADTKRGGVFDWVGREARSLFVRTSLRKQQTTQRRLYIELGEKLTARPPEGELSRGMRGSLMKAAEIKMSLAELNERKDLLLEEQHKAWKVFGNEVSPERKITVLERYIARIGRELGELFRDLGRSAAAATADFEAFFGEEAKEILKKIEETRALINADDEEKARLEAAIKACEERASVEKWERAIDSQKRRIKAAEASIDTYVRRIEEAKKRIAELEY